MATPSEKNDMSNMMPFLPEPQLVNGGSQPSEKRKSKAKMKATPCLYDEYEEKVRPCIDLIDSLRALGVEKDLALPAIAVIGDQSSGKSSVLEALSGVSLPRGSGIVTRCPLVLKLKKLGCDQQWNGKIGYRDLEIPLPDPSVVEREIHQAQDTMAGTGVSISEELITLEINSPNVPDLTLIDLPGITRVAVGNQPHDIGKKIKSLIHKYIKKQETINLVVVPSNVDIATTEALNMAQEVDPKGERTLGILTKPDLVDKGAEESIVSVVRNLTIFLNKGYMIVKCRGQKDIQDKLSLAMAIENERLFFEEHEHFRVLLEENKATVPALAERLTTELIEHITKALPTLEQQIKDKLQEATEDLRKCGADLPEADEDKIFFLIDKIKAFNQDITSLIQGEEALPEEGLRLFSQLRRVFQKWGGTLTKTLKDTQTAVTWEITASENRYRGKELPGFVNYKMFETIVKQCLNQLEEPAVDMLQEATGIIGKAYTKVAHSHFVDFFNLHRVVKGKLEDLKATLVKKAEEMIRLQFQMEQIVFCQDAVYSSKLQEVRENTAKENSTARKPAHQENCLQAEMNYSRAEMSEHLKAYFRETDNRLTCEIPMIVQFFVLQNYGNLLQKSVMQLLQEKDQLDWLLREQQDTSNKRKFLKERIGRLNQARRRLSHFPG
ncbi:interferon-induced GTP-binding protein Mx1-like isoform X2 [Tachyglossus aculeatus]|uniref:interferon-induced GTP-binding protein Mx1-like isoform X2 n=1 Tax=Tachyglossus aculeatus TaxID=9261 RepID=UPI0018F3D512|nr:interferon-induced GTP-binding protein Mx1-like isoform X2 [Tachyglossus aculeatus]